MWSVFLLALLGAATPEDCIMTKFGAWSTCSASCGTGSQERVRSIVTAATFGGVGCKALRQASSSATNTSAGGCAR